MPHDLTTLKNTMKRQLLRFNDEQVDINDTTVLSEVLSDNDGFDPASSSKNVFKNLIKWALSVNGNALKDWPSNWTAKTVEQLAKSLL